MKWAQFLLLPPRPHPEPVSPTAGSGFFLPHDQAQLFPALGRLPIPDSSPRPLPQLHRLSLLTPCASPDSVCTFCALWTLTRTSPTSSSPAQLRGWY